MAENGIGFFDLDRLFLRCRRPLWDGRAPPVDDQRYCGAPTTPGSSWCPACAARLTLPPPVVVRRKVAPGAEARDKNPLVERTLDLVEGLAA